MDFVVIYEINVIFVYVFNFFLMNYSSFNKLSTEACVDFNLS